MITSSDLFLRDIRDYRVQQLAGTGIEPLFPLWEMPTRQLAETMIGSGLQAHLTCIDPSKLDPAFAGAAFDVNFLARLPVSMDPCGENGEFHTFVCDSPDFSEGIPISVGEIVERDGFVFADFLPEP